VARTAAAGERELMARDDELVFLPLGGAGEIGMNLNCYGLGPPDARKWIVVDCGVTFGREFSTPGVDVIMPDVRFLEENRSDLLGIVITHAHEDHLGAVAYLWPRLRCPVFATPFTARLLQDKLEEANLETQVRVRVVPLGGKFTLGPFGIEFITITHSILEPNVVAIRTPLGTIIHTGDWKIDPDPLIGEKTDDAALRALGTEGVLAMVCDSTNIFVEGESGSEADVQKALHKLIGGLKGRVAVTAFASNVARLQSIAHAARTHGREIVLVGRSMHRMVQAAKDTGYLPDFPSLVSEDDAVHLPADHVLYLCTGSQGEPRAALARIAAGNHPRVELGQGDTVIFSSRVIPGNEIAIHELHNDLSRLGVTVLSAEDHFVHVSGHPARGELAEMYRWVRPKIAIPVHGETRHIAEHVRFAQSMQVPHTVAAANGEMVRLAPGPPTQVDEVPSGRIFMDGKLLTTEDDGYARSRRGMGFAGFIGITMVVDRRGRLAADPVLHMEGVPEVVREPVLSAIDGLMRGQKQHHSDLAESVRRVARRSAEGVWGKKPVVRVQVVDI
jgi:ribonuclease J